MKRLAALIALTFLWAPAALAYTSPGKPTGFVNDFAQVLSGSTKAELESELTQFEKSTSNEIAVAIVPSLDGDYVENYAVKLFEEWGIGKKNTDNGVLLLLAIEDRKMRIEVGYGLEGALPDSVAQSILDNEMTPLLKAGNYDGAVTAGVHAIEQATKGEYTATQTSPVLSAEAIANLTIFFIIFVIQFLGAILARSRSWWAGGIIGFLGGLSITWILAVTLFIALPIVIALTLLGLLFDYLVSKGYAGAKARGVSPPWWTGGSGFSGGGGGGSFGGFSGGSSGGGGASGSW